MPARRQDERTGYSFLAAIVGGSVSGGTGNSAAADTHLHDEAPENRPSNEEYKDADDDNHQAVFLNASLSI